MGQGEGQTREVSLELKAVGLSLGSLASHDLESQAVWDFKSLSAILEESVCLSGILGCRSREYLRGI